MADVYFLIKFRIYKKILLNLHVRVIKRIEFNLQNCKHLYIIIIIYFYSKNLYSKKVFTNKLM